MKPAQCRVSEVTDDMTVLVSFQHSELIPEEAHKVKCGLYAHKKTGKRVAVVAVDDDHVFSGSELPAENTIAHNLIAIRNRQTNKVRLVPTTSFLLSPVPRVEENSIVSVVTQEDRDRLQMKFGSKRQQRSLESYTRMRTNADYLKDKLKDVIDSVSVEEASQQPVVNASHEAYLPPINRIAATVDDVYSLHDIVSAEELASLKEEAIRTMKEPKKDMFSSFFSQTLPNVLQLGSSQPVIESVCALLYADLLIKFLNTSLKSLQKQKNIVCPYSEDVNSKIINTFTVQSPHGRLRPNLLKDKALCHLLVLGLILSHFKLNLELLSKSLSISVKRLNHLSQQVGAVSSSSSSSIVTLKLPLPPLKQLQTVVKRNKKH
ncbi:DNA-directed RNA polymerase I subunit rpa49 [Zootermopsis nevadensis]|uniref:DNA-directed RNA polymerase I subunit RPA49 n=1 Tax=Zootermopsis nevadensis TaxID=136037 RepID=A0A067RT28_ZOONE|nr:DNA-directed RNA polymerase I subunit rpa49 [Zootermopsis nevadensis]KDR22974.1 DNA-directed RNA polymerase I subunit RPA49 [Zootermopsis nevadensis]